MIFSVTQDCVLYLSWRQPFPSAALLQYNRYPRTDEITPNIFLFLFFMRGIT